MKHYQFSILLIIQIVITVFISKSLQFKYRQLSIIDDRTVVRLNNGAHIFGTLYYDHNFFNGPIEIYKSIRYANVTERFQLAEPFVIQNDYDAIDYRELCMQHDPFKFMSENCLYLNIWRPFREICCGDELKPVIVYIHGGGFQAHNINGINRLPSDGSGYVDKGDVVFVSIQYRVGALGFLYAGDRRAPGNQGIHDMILALKWIGKNIKSFGGDPTSVTLMGESAGSWAISALILSPMAKGLFHRAILHSGSIIEYKQYSPDYALEKTIKIGLENNCPVNDMNKLIECLGKVSPYKLASKLIKLPQLLEGKFTGLIYKDFNGILPDNPSILLKNGQINPVDLIVGHTYSEYGFYLAITNPLLLKKHKIYDRWQFYRIFKHYMARFEIPSVYHAKIFNFYAKTNRFTYIGIDVRRILIEFLSDYRMTCPTLIFGQEYSNTLKRLRNNATDYPIKRVYAFRFDHYSPFMQIFACFEWMKSCHFIDLPYMMGMPIYRNPFGIIFNVEDQIISNELINSYINFIYTGSPMHFRGQSWPRFDNFDTQQNANETWTQMSIGLRPKLIHNYYRERCNFFKKFMLESI